MISALQLDRRVQRAAGAVAYLAVNVPIAILAVFAVLGVMLGAALSVIRVGLPLVLGAAAACRWLLRADRRGAVAAFIGYVFNNERAIAKKAGFIALTDRQLREQAGKVGDR